MERAPEDIATRVPAQRERRSAARRSPAFEPARYERDLAAIWRALAESEAFSADAERGAGEPARRTRDAFRALDRVLKRHPRDGRGLFSRSELIAGLRYLRERGALPAAVAAREDEWLARLRLRPVRTLSGVTPITVLTRPHPCPGRCVFCPNDARMPKSYLSDEPGAQRATDHDFDPYRQTWARLATYHAMGHPVDKAELIVLGGTWSFHPGDYQRWFVTRCLEALNDFGARRDRRGTAGRAVADFSRLPRALDARGGDAAYNRAVGALLDAALGPGLLHASERASEAALAAAQRANESARVRCVGLSIETRPDHVDERELVRLRRLGVTKVQLGVQSLRDDVLAANRRGHDVAASRRALRLLRGAGFKLQLHWMPNLLGATPASDLADYERIFADPDFRPDELKLYPCHLVESAELVRHHERGEWRPYGDGALLALVSECLAGTPPWCRVSRVIRDFSADDILAGTHIANLREHAEARLRSQGRPARDIRAREVRGTATSAARAEQRVHEYATSIGRELFLERVGEGDRLLGFLRLALPQQPAPIAELGASALIRELHVYGASQPLGRRDPRAAQHTGLGGELVETAARVASERGYRSLAVISAIGTRGYYRRLGFRDGPLYQHRELRV
jgi:elongator complex protein 3